MISKMWTVPICLEDQEQATEFYEQQLRFRVPGRVREDEASVRRQTAFPRNGSPSGARDPS